jgi:hypothetical protein
LRNPLKVSAHRVRVVSAVARFRPWLSRLSSSSDRANVLNHLSTVFRPGKINLFRSIVPSFIFESAKRTRPSVERAADQSRNSI